MVFDAMQSTTGVPFPLSMDSEANGIMFGSGDESIEPNASGIALVIGDIRPYIYGWTNFNNATAHPIWQGDNFKSGFLSGNWLTNDWRSVLAMHAMFNADLRLFAPTTYLTNHFVQALLTNASFISVWQDPEQRRARVSSFNAINGIFFSKKSPGFNSGGWFVVMENEDNAHSTNLTFNLSDIFLTNTVCDAVDIYTAATWEMSPTPSR